MNIYTIDYETDALTPEIEEASKTLANTVIANNLEDAFLKAKSAIGRADIRVAALTKKLDNVRFAGLKFVDEQPAAPAPAPEVTN